MAENEDARERNRKRAAAYRARNKADINARRKAQRVSKATTNAGNTPQHNPALELPPLPCVLKPLPWHR